MPLTSFALGFMSGVRYGNRVREAILREGGTDRVLERCVTEIRCLRKSPPSRRGDDLYAGYQEGRILGILGLE